MIGILELLIILIFCVPWLIAFIDILRSDFQGHAKMIWLIAVILVPFLGAMAYFIIGRKQKIKNE
jgi:heme/copper-type cytochrome/quinol oxidase subunit 2